MASGRFVTGVSSVSVWRVCSPSPTSERGDAGAAQTGQSRSLPAPRWMGRQPDSAVPPLVFILDSLVGATAALSLPLWSRIGLRSEPSLASLLWDSEPRGPESLGSAPWASRAPRCEGSPWLAVAAEAHGTPGPWGHRALGDARAARCLQMRGHTPARPAQS